MKNSCCGNDKSFRETTPAITRDVRGQTADQLDLRWDNGTVTAYKQVPQEVYRRLCSAPNPATYWEDRIAEEYPKATSKKQAGDSDADEGFGILFEGG